ncbi:MAG: metal-dependent hydrolase [Burkholderiales bacterium]|nr:metal-dependent hydrolase [Burkholderiales bacterium]
MDSLTQIVLGASVAAAVVPAAHRRRAMAAGAILGTLPDLDGIPLSLLGADAVTGVTWHRGPSHSLPVLLLAGWLIWLALRRWWAPVREAPRPWLWATWLALLTHPLLDAFTVYGTQLLWPTTASPVMWSSLFIIDPGYTLPLIVGCIGALWLGARAGGARFIAWGLILSTAYLGWSLTAKWMVARATAPVLAQQGLQDAPGFSVPMPLNTFLWRVVVQTPDGQFIEGYRSLLADRGAMRFQPIASDAAALEAMKARPAVQRLLWFTSGFMKATAEGDSLLLSDLRMGAEPDYTFVYRVARRDGAQGAWQPIVPELVAQPRNIGRQWDAMWRRLWNEPAAPAALPAPRP